LSQLISLNIVYCSSIRDEGLERLVLNMQKLEKLYIRRCKKITDFGIFTLARCCKKLKVLDVSDCAITEKTIKWISSGGLAITRLVAKFCVHIDFTNLDKGALSANSLQTIKLDNCTQLWDSMVISLLSGATSLKVLSLRGCTKITRVAVLKLTMDLKGLLELDLSSCNQLQEDLISDVEKINPKLVVVFDLYYKRQIGIRAPMALVSREESVKERFTNIPRNLSLTKPGFMLK
jgi:hypothetical protein